MTYMIKLWLTFLLALGGVTVGTLAYDSAISPDFWMYVGNGQWADVGPHPAPGPVIGAGLPALLLIGGGWVVLRFRRKAP
jgi:hypothetical protein